MRDTAKKNGGSTTSFRSVGDFPVIAMAFGSKSFRSVPNVGKSFCAFRPAFSYDCCGVAASCNANVCRHELCAASRVNPGGASPPKERVAVPATSRRRDDPSFDVAGPGRASPPSGSQHPRGRRLPPRRRLQSLRRRLGGAARWRRSAAEGSCAALHAANRPTSVAHCRGAAGSGGASRRGSRLPCGITRALRFSLRFACDHRQASS